MDSVPVDTSPVVVNVLFFGSFVGLGIDLVPVTVGFVTLILLTDVNNVSETFDVVLLDIEDIDGLEVVAVTVSDTEVSENSTPFVVFPTIVCVDVDITGSLTIIVVIVQIIYFKLNFEYVI